MLFDETSSGHDATTTTPTSFIRKNQLSFISEDNSKYSLNIDLGTTCTGDDSEQVNLLRTAAQLLVNTEQQRSATEIELDRVQEDYLVLQMQLEELKYTSGLRITSLEDTIVSICAEYDRNIASLETENYNLKAQIDAMHARYGSKITAIETQNTTLSSQHNQLIHEYNTMRSDLLEYETTLNAQNKTLKLQEQQINTLQIELTASKHTVQTQSDVISQSTSRYKQEINALERQLSVLKSDVLRLTDENTSYKTLNTERHQLFIDQGAMFALTTQNANELSAKNKTLTQQNTQIKEEIKQLTNSIQNNVLVQHDTTQQNNTLEIENKQIKLELELRVNDIKQYKQSDLKRQKTLKIKDSETQQFLAQITQLRVENDNLTVQINELNIVITQQNDTIHTLQQENEQLSQYIESQNVEINTLQTQLQLQTSEINRIKQKCNEQSSFILSLHTDITQLTNTNYTHTQTIQHLEHTIDKMKQKEKHKTAELKIIFDTLRINDNKQQAKHAHEINTLKTQLHENKEQLLMLCDMSSYVLDNVEQQGSANTSFYQHSTDVSFLHDVQNTIANNIQYSEDQYNTQNTAQREQQYSQNVESTHHIEVTNTTSEEVTSYLHFTNEVNVVELYLSRHSSFNSATDLIE